MRGRTVVKRVLKDTGRLVHLAEDRAGGALLSVCDRQLSDMDCAPFCL